MHVHMQAHMFIDAAHVLFMLAPILVLLAHLSGKDVRVAASLVLLAFSVVPHTWNIMKKCPLTAMSKKQGGLKSAHTSSAFSEIYLGWLYFPAIRLSGHEITDRTMNVACSVHHLVYLVMLIWLVNAP